MQQLGEQRAPPCARRTAPRVQPRSPTRCCQVVGWIRDHAQSAACVRRSSRAPAPPPPDALDRHPQRRAQLPHPLAPGAAAVVAGDERRLERPRDRRDRAACSRTRRAAGARAPRPAASSARPRPPRRSRSTRRGGAPSPSAARRGCRSGSRRAGARRRRRRRSRPPSRRRSRARSPAPRRPRGCASACRSSHQALLAHGLGDHAAAAQDPAARRLLAQRVARASRRRARRGRRVRPTAARSRAAAAAGRRPR